MTDDPIEAAIEAGYGKARELCVHLYVSYEDTEAIIRAAAPILREHYIREGREQAAIDLDNTALSADSRGEWCCREHASYASRIARGGEDG